MLTKKQEKIIKEYFDNDMLDETNVDYYVNYNEMFKKLEKIKDTETLSTDIKRYILDLESESGNPLWFMRRV